MKREFLVGLLTGLFFSAMAGIASADLIDQGNTIYDDDTELEWFVLTETIGFSYNQMLTNFADADSQFYGYSYATTSDLNTLWGNAGYTGDFYSFTNDPDDIAAVTELYTLFGKTGTFVYNRADGRYDDGGGGDIGLAFLIPNFPDLGSLARLLPDYIDIDDVRGTPVEANNVGSWIYKSTTETAPVPEPTTILLFGTGLAGLAGYRRRGARKK